MSQFARTYRSSEVWKQGSVLFNDAINTFYLRLYGVRHIMVKDHSARGKTSCRHYMGYSFRLAARVLLYAPSHRQDNTYHGLCYTSRGSLAGMRSKISRPHNRRLRPYVARHDRYRARGSIVALRWNRQQNRSACPTERHYDCCRVP